LRYFTEHHAHPTPRTALRCSKPELSIDRQTVESYSPKTRLMSISFARGVIIEFFSDLWQTGRGEE